MEEFEGYKVPECTEEEVRGFLERRSCYAVYTSADCQKILKERGCHSCLLNYLEDENREALQRYLDHRWPKKVAERVAVHCRTQEEWDRVSEKASKAGHQKCRSSWSSHRENSCLAFNWNSPFNTATSPSSWWKEEGYTIISAVEYLGEEDILISLFHTARQVALDKEFLLTSNTKEEDMNNVIAEVYKDKKYEEVVMVNKYFGDVVGNKIADNEFGKILLEAHKDDVFEKAEALKKAEEEANKK